MRSPGPSHTGSQTGRSARTPSWATAAGSPDTSPIQLTDLGDHVGRCNGSRGRMFALRCAADAFAGFVAPRFVTSLVVVSIVLGVGSLII